MGKLGKIALAFLAAIAMCLGVSACSKDKPTNNNGGQSSSSSVVDSSSSSVVESSSSVVTEESVTYTVTNPMLLECDEATLVLYGDNTFLLTCVRVVRIEGVYDKADNEMHLTSDTICWWGESDWEEPDVEVKYGEYEVFGSINASNSGFTVRELVWNGEESEPEGGDVVVTTFYYDVSNPEKMDSRSMRLEIKLHNQTYRMHCEIYIEYGRANCLAVVEGIFEVDSDGVYHLDARKVEYIGQSAMTDVPAENKHWDFTGTTNGEQFTIITGGRDYVICHSDAYEALSVESLDAKLYADGTYEVYMLIYDDGENVEILSRGVYTITDGIYHLDAREYEMHRPGNRDSEGELEPEETAFDIYGTLNGEQFTITGGGASPSTGNKRMFSAINPQKVNALAIVIEFTSDVDYSCMIQIPYDEDTTYLAAVTGVYTVTDGEYHWDARHVIIQRGDQTMVEDLPEDATMFDVYGTINEEEGTFFVTGGGATYNPGNERTLYAVNPEELNSSQVLVIVKSNNEYEMQVFPPQDTIHDNTVLTIVGTYYINGDLWHFDAMSAVMYMDGEAVTEETFELEDSAFDVDGYVDMKNGTLTIERQWH